jgi:oligopeptide/dipeptide ABC transporter ATP-binding protein
LLAAEHFSFNRRCVFGRKPASAGSGRTFVDSRTAVTPLLELRNVKKYFPAGGGRLPWVSPRWIKAVDGVNLSISAGETLGLVGESGCGKTTTTRLILRLERPTQGQVLFEGCDVFMLKGRDLQRYRQAVQAVFQDPYSSLNPRMRIGDIIGEPLDAQGELSRKAIKAKVAEALSLVGLRPTNANRFPHEFSGGQRQRVAIARAIATSARLIVLDEPVSALDVSIRAQIMTLLEDLQRQLGVSYLFIGHDLATVLHISQRIAVMYLGNIVEEASADALSTLPMHPYTRALFAAALPPDPFEAPAADIVEGAVPTALAPPAGCHFHPRCPYAMPRCSVDAPRLVPVDGRSVACHLVAVPDESGLRETEGAGLGRPAHPIPS